MKTYKSTRKQDQKKIYKNRSLSSSAVNLDVMTVLTLQDRTVFTSGDNSFKEKCCLRRVSFLWSVYWYHAYTIVSIFNSNSLIVFLSETNGNLIVQGFSLIYILSLSLFILLLSLFLHLFSSFHHFPTNPLCSLSHVFFILYYIVFIHGIFILWNYWQLWSSSFILITLQKSSIMALGWPMFSI